MRISLASRFAGLVVMVGCGSSAMRPDVATPDAGLGSSIDGGDASGDGHIPGLGAHSLKYYKYMGSLPATLSTASLETQSTGSTILVNIGRGDNTKFVLPTDNKGNSPYQQLDQMHPYSPYFPDSGTALYAYADAKGGSNFQVTTATRSDATMDEITLAVVEIVERTHIQDVKWNQPVTDPIKSESVTTTGPATLIAFWWGNAFPGTPQKAMPDNDFVPIDWNTQETDGFVQCEVATKDVTAAGTYDVTWTSEPAQGAQLWLVAVQHD
jgi:hypothetical protein